MIIAMSKLSINGLFHFKSNHSFTHQLSIIHSLIIFPFPFSNHTFVTNTTITKHIKIIIHRLHFLLLLSLLLPRRLRSRVRHRLLQQIQHRTRRNRHRARTAQSHAIFFAVNDRVRNLVENRFCVAFHFHGVRVSPLREKIAGRTGSEPINSKRKYVVMEEFSS